MAVRDWSGRRIAFLWIVGAVVEAALVLLPGMAFRRYLQHNMPRLEREHARLQSERAITDSAWRRAERADSLSVAAQRRRAIAAGQYTLDANGDTLVSVVRVPSGRPDSVAIATSVARTVRRGIALVLAVWAIIPVALLSLTGWWLWGRRRTA